MRRCVLVKVMELTGYTRRLLRGKRLRTLMICMLPLAAELFFRSAEVCVYVMLLYFGELKPLGLFTGESVIQTAAVIILTLLRLTILAPLTFACGYKLCEITGRKRHMRLSRLLLNRHFFRRSLGALLLTRLLGLVSLVPAAFFGTTAYSLLIRAKTPGELFLTAHAMVLTAVSVGIWLSLKLSLVPVPFLMAIWDKSVFGTVIHSIKLMRGRKKLLIKLIAIYAPLMLTLVGLPFALPELMTAISLSTDIYIKEEEYLEAEFHRQEPDNAPAFSHGGKGRFKAASE